MSFCALLFSLAFASASQIPLTVHDRATEDQYHHFEPPIRHVAVIGAGPAGLQYAAVLRDEGFDVRLLDRAPGPGGNWLSTSAVPIKASFPNRAIKNGSYTPDVPDKLPLVQEYFEGDGGLSLEYRWREHWNPSPVWEHLTSNSAPFFTSLPETQYPADIEWALPQSAIRRHVRSYASAKGLNANDEESLHVTSYSTRVEYIHKAPSSHKWTLYLRRLSLTDNTRSQLRAEWWSEEVDAIVVAVGYDSTHVPNIPGLIEWAGRFPEQVYHSREYRRPEKLAGKNVLIIGASVSASEIARDLAPHVRSFSVSIRDHERTTYMQRRSLRRLPSNISHIPEIASFGTIPDDATGIQELDLHLLNGTTIRGFDEIILATGFVRSLPFLADYHNSTIKGREEPEVDVHPIITDGSHLRSLYWTGHYIPDPTLAFKVGRPWTLGTYHALLLARTWKGKARLPNEKLRWEGYEGPGGPSVFDGGFGTLGEEGLRFSLSFSTSSAVDMVLDSPPRHIALNRKLLVHLNTEALKFGGRLVAPWPVEGREKFVYYAEQAWEAGYTRSENFTRYENVPESEWNSEVPDVTWIPEEW
ncbi:FAD/NAD(P)-binding domain-containing protein [Exidia glandulosa HHB12029]|uniref:FAD/NAD(P)-binding domain-containing protein n=1 Tax=Exidia glandulosa HHB12029 TaxID=1314781 RepID=A0A166AJ23_EXIGL|nr:FAD/NAD(P)-binding domain-containing protein [Exidia glandulosa HHB12029]